ncbi:hypothetical protein [Absidia glauca]|uniref:Uncharacterized protein n=1 Tax=Absidia glauca TaxID=4829 RepID=A0A168QUD5_ABSGL|nr:hypothetical protein [Absidia glauca]
MSLDFKPGCYSLKTGKTFLNPSDNGHDFYALQCMYGPYLSVPYPSTHLLIYSLFILLCYLVNTTTLEPSLPLKKASLRQRKATYYADWAWADKVLSYEGTKGNLHELECLLVFDEDTHTFTLERPSVKMSMKRAQKKRLVGSASASTSALATPAGNLYLPHPPKNKPRPSKGRSASSPIATIPSPRKKRSSSNGIIPPATALSPATYDDRKTSSQPLPMSLALPPPLKPQNNQQNDTQAPDPAPVATPSFDDVDILSDIDEILNSDDDNDDDDDEFETIIPVPMDPMNIEPAPPSQSPQPTNMSISSDRQPILQTSGKRRRPALKMASAPIRRLDASPPTPTLSNRPVTGHKTTSATKRQSSTLSSSSSSSSSEGSSSSDDGSSTDGSNGHHRDDDDVSSSGSSDEG